MELSILAYGDSLTWGRDPATRERHAIRDRWPSVLQAELGASRVHAEGLPGRTTVFDDHANGINRNGAVHLPVVLSTHGPFDIVVLMLGTNDLKPSVCGMVSGTVAGLRRLVFIVRGFPYQPAGPAPRVIIVSPPILCTTSAGDGPRGGREITESEKLAPAIKSLCTEIGCEFFDAARVANTSPVDGVHLNALNTRAIGAAIARII